MARLTVPSRWERAILICRKCSKKVGGGFGEKGRTPLAKALRSATGGGKKRKAPIGIVEVKCLGLCPKRMVTVVDATAPGTWRLIAPGRPVTEIADELGLPARPER